MPDGSSFQDSEVVCPYCGRILHELTCASCGTICLACGTPFTGEICPECDGNKNQARPRRDVTSEFVATAKGRGRFTQQAVDGRRNAVLMRGSSSDDSRARLIHDRIVTACDKLPVSPSMRSAIAARVQDGLGSLRRDSELGTNEAIAFLILSEMRRLGFPLRKVQDSLARAGFRMKLGTISLAVAIPAGSKPSVRVNGFRRGARVTPSSSDLMLTNLVDVLGLAGHETYTLRIQLYLLDALSDGREAWIDLAGEGGYILHRGAMLRRLRVPLPVSKCFFLFKTEKVASVDNGKGAPILNVGAFLRPVLPSKALPISSELMRVGGRLGEVEARTVETFRALISKSPGKSPQRLAQEALYFADQKSFQNCDTFARSRLRVKLEELVFNKQRDIEYTGKRGFLVPSEVDRIFGSRS